MTVLNHAGPHASHSDTKLGLRWHKLLSDVLKPSDKPKKTEEELAAGDLVQSLQKEFGVELVDCDFPLYGYVYNKEETAPNI